MSTIAWVGKQRRRRSTRSTGLILVTLLILSFGGTVERMLERASYFMMGFVFLFLVTVNVAFIPASHWWETLAGFFRFRLVSEDLDWALVTALVATAGSGGMGNLCVTSWARDKGFAMARYSGAIPSGTGQAERLLYARGADSWLTGGGMRAKDTILRRWRLSRRGQSLVEFALVLPLLMVLFLGLVAGIVMNVIKHRGTGQAVPWTDGVVLSSAALLVWLIAATIFEWAYKPAQQGRKVAYLTVASFVFLALVMAILVAGGSQHAAPRASGAAALPLPLGEGRGEGLSRLAGSQTLTLAFSQRERELASAPEAAP